MQYLLLIYGDMSAFPEMSEDEQRASMEEWSDYSNWLHREGLDAGWRRPQGRRPGHLRPDAER